MALAQGDWVSVKHRDLIEFVLKWMIRGTLLIQSWGPIRLGGLAFPPTCCMLISLCTESKRFRLRRNVIPFVSYPLRDAWGHIYMYTPCLQDTELHFTLPSQMLYDGCFNTAPFATETARLLYVYMQIHCHSISLCCCCSLINNLILQASRMWQHFCHIVMYFLRRPPLRFIYVDEAVMTHYNSPCQTHQDAWFAGMSMSSVSLKPQQQQLKWHNGLVEQNAVCVRACVMCVCGFMTVYQASGAWMFAHVPLSLCGWAFALAQSNKSIQDKYFCLFFVVRYIQNIPMYIYI